jgi:hypothetical protein
MIKNQLKEVFYSIKYWFIENITWKLFPRATSRFIFRKSYPINSEYWDQMETFSIMGAALYSFNIDPYAIQFENDTFGHGTVTSKTLPPGFFLRQKFIISAVLAGSIEIAKNTKPGIDMNTLIKIDSFKQWLVKKNYTNQQMTEKSPKADLLSQNDREDLSVINEDNLSDDSDSSIAAIQSQHQEVKNDGSNKVAIFNPVLPAVPISGIAKMFRRSMDETENLAIWRKDAKNAKRNSLIKARLKVVGGKAESLYYPEKVGDWVESKGYMARDRIKRILDTNLPKDIQYYNDLRD